MPSIELRSYFFGAAPTGFHSVCFSHVGHRLYEQSGGEACPQRHRAPHVRFGSKADIGARPIDVRFTSESGHWLSVVMFALCHKQTFRAALRA